MELAAEDLVADFSWQPESPGVTSLLRHCFGDDEACGGDVTSFNATGNDSPAGPRQETTTGYGQPMVMCEIQENEQPAHHQLHSNGESGMPYDVGAFVAPACTPGFSLGTSAPAIPFTRDGYPGLAAVARRRGRKPKPRLPDLQQRLDGLNEQFKQLSKENIFLRNKLKVLERVVPYRDESAGFLTQLLSSAPAAPAAAHVLGRALKQLDAAVVAAEGAGPSTRTPPDRARAQSPTASVDAADSNSSGSRSGLSALTPGTSVEAQSSHAPADSGSTGSGAVGSAGRGRCRSSNAAAIGIAVFASLTASDIAAAGRGCIPSASSQQRQQQQRSGQPAGLSGTPALLALCPSPDGEVPSITLAGLEELKRVTAQDFRMLWKHICLQLGVLVTGADVHGPGSPPYVRLERFLERALSYMDKITLLSPACFVHSMYTNVETGEPERPPDNFWITCARSLQLSSQQLREVNSLAAVYELNVVPVVQQRLQLAMQLSTRLAAATAPQRGGAAAGSSSNALAAPSSVDELAEQLERNVLKEHQTHWNIGDFLCSSVLTPLQVARALSVCYPYIPDGIAMLHAFKLISAQEDARQASVAAEASKRAEAAPNPAALQPQPQANANPQPFPSLAGLLASQLPALAVGLASGAGKATACGVSATGALQQLAGDGVGAGCTGRMAGLAALAKFADGLPPAQLQQALAAGLGLQQQQQGAQQQPFLAGLQATALAARTTLQPPLGAVTVRSTTSPPAAPMGLPTASAAQLQGLAALLGAIASAQQTAGAQPSTHAR